MSACSVCGKLPCYEHERRTITRDLGLGPVEPIGNIRARVKFIGDKWAHRLEAAANAARAADLVRRLKEDARGAKSPCCMRRARARYWRIARGYFGLGAALGVAVGMLLGALSKVCP